MDVRTLIVTLAFCSALSAVLIFLLHRRGRPAPGVRLWVWGQGAYAVGWILFCCRDVLPPFLTIFVANLFRILGPLLVLQGIRLFLGRPLLPARSPLGAFVLLLALPWAWYLFVEPSMAMRYILVVFLHMGLRLVIARELWEGAQDGKRIVLRVLSFVFLVVAILLFLRALAEIWIFDPRDLLRQGLLTALHGLLLIGEVMVVTVGLCLMVIEHLEGRVETLEGFLPICAYCKKIRSDGGEWQQMEAYFLEKKKTRFSHGVCPECEVRLVDELGAEP